MTIRIIGAALVILSCSAVGFSLAAAHKREERCLQGLQQAIAFMICELEFRQTPLPDLCRMAAREASGVVGDVLNAAAKEMEGQLMGDAATCMRLVLQQWANIPVRTERNFEQLGQSLGRFALSGQVSGLRAVSIMCQRDLDSLSLDREARLRSYRTLGICCGVALAILFM